MLNMKKITIILFVLLLMCTTARSSFAQVPHAAGAKKAKANTETIRGKVISVDTANNAIVVKENKTGVEKKITVDSTVISSLKVNEELKVTVKEGSNIATSVKEIVKKASSTKK
jgi:hypothetical protein